MVFSLVVPLVTATARPPRSRNDRIGESLRTRSLVPETKIVGENATRFCRSRLLVVEPHSRSTCPLTTASMRDSAVTGTHFVASVLCTASLMKDGSAPETPPAPNAQVTNNAAADKSTIDVEARQKS